MLNLGLMAGLVITLVFIAGCTPTGVPGEEDSNMVPFIFFLILIFGLMYFVMIRPQRKRQQQQQQIMAELKRGDKVITAGGIYGQVESVTDESVVLKIESGTTIRVARGSVALRQEEEKSVF